MQLHDLSEFFNLSATVNYQLAGAGVGVPNLVALLDPGGDLDGIEREVLRGVLEYLKEAYGDSRRRLGPLAILHPIRCAALLTRASGKPCLLDLLTSLLHDQREDFGDGRLTGRLAPGAEERFQALLDRLDSEGEWFLMERIEWLTRRESGETYYTYMGRLLSHARQTPEIIRVKLADRLDNTLDMRVALEDPLHHVDFFEEVFRLLFLPAHAGYRPTGAHPPSSPINGAVRLYQLFKNTVLLSLLREAFPDRDDRVVAILYDAVAQASMREAQRIVLHLFGFHLTRADDQRAVLADALEYCRGGGATRVCDPASELPLDGFFIEHFDYPESADRKAAIAALYDDKPLMARAAMTLVSTFQSFLTDPDFRVQGLSIEGCAPVAS